MSTKQRTGIRRKKADGVTDVDVPAPVLEERVAIRNLLARPGGTWTVIRAYQNGKLEYSNEVVTAIVDKQLTPRSYASLAVVSIIDTMFAD